MNTFGMTLAMGRQAIQRFEVRSANACDQTSQAERSRPVSS